MLTVSELRTRLKLQGAAQVTEMCKALSLAPVAYARWMDEPIHDPLPEDMVLEMEQWVMGRYGFDNNTGKWIKVHHPQEPQRLGTYAEVFKNTRPPYVAGRSYSVGQRVVPAKNQGKDLPSPEQLKMKAKMAAQLAADRAEAAKRQESFLTLPSFGRKKESQVAT
jgi:hypothetical protein